MTEESDAVEPRARSLFIVDNSESGWTGMRYLEEWTGISKTFDIATGYFEIGSLLGLDGIRERAKTPVVCGQEARAALREGLLDVGDNALDLRLAHVGLEDEDGLVLALTCDAITVRPHGGGLGVWIQCVAPFGPWGPAVRDQGERGGYPVHLAGQEDLGGPWALFGGCCAKHAIGREAGGFSKKTHIFHAGSTVVTLSEPRIPP